MRHIIWVGRFFDGSIIHNLYIQIRASLAKEVFYWRMKEDIYSLLARRNISEITRPDQWYYLLRLIEQYYYAGKYGMSKRLVSSIDNPALSDGQGVIDGIIKNAVASQSPIPLVSFCGIGDKDGLDDRDYIGFNAFGGLNEHISKYYKPGIAVSVIIADIHGVFNGYYNETYAQAAQDHLVNQAWVAQTVKLSDLYNAYRLYLPTPEMIDGHVATFLEEQPELSEQLSVQAQRHYKGEHDGYGHLLYAHMRLQERDMLMSEFGYSMLMVHGSPSNSRDLLPSMGILYLNMEPHWFRKDD